MSQQLVFSPKFHVISEDINCKDFYEQLRITSAVQIILYCYGTRWFITIPTIDCCDPVEIFKTPFSSSITMSLPHQCPCLSKLNVELNK
jgi:hypothetical protein